MKSLKRHLPAFPAILTAVTLVALLWLWNARADVLQRLDGKNEGSSAAEQVLPLPQDSPSETSQPPSPTNDPGVEVFIPQASPEAVPATDESESTAPPNSQFTDHSGVLNGPRQFALGMIETGNDDRAIGGLGEVSRFQIMPSVWKHYSDSRKYQDPDVSVEVARRHWTALYEYFKKKAEREPTDFDMYVLWNTRYGYYASKGFAPDQLHPVIRDRAQRFTNLVEDGVRREAVVKLASSRG